MASNPINVVLVAAGQYHDIDFARMELLKLLGEEPRFRTRVAENYHDLESISDSDMLITYTCNLVPKEEEQLALRDWITSGGKWFALHGTNSILEFLEDGKVNSPETAPVLMETLGTQFIAHPPIQPFTVRKAAPDHELIKGIDEFETDDELYLSRVLGDITELLYADYSGEAPGFVEDQWTDDARRPVYYIHSMGKGEVLYLNLGHCRGHYDMRPMIDYYPKIERGSWEKEEYYELLRRGIKYCAGL